MGMFNKSKFVFSETFNNANGKTSGTGFIGVILGLVGSVSFVGAMIGYYFNLPNTLEVMGYVLQVIAASAVLMGVRKISGDFAKNDSVSAAVLDKIDSSTGVEEKG
jgi:hypothetical protein